MYCGIIEGLRANAFQFPNSRRHKDLEKVHYFPQQMFKCLLCAVGQKGRKTNYLSLRKLYSKEGDSK